MGAITPTIDHVATRSATQRPGLGLLAWVGGVVPALGGVRRVTFSTGCEGHNGSMGLLRDRDLDSGELRPVGATFSPTAARAQESAHSDRIRQWVQAHRPPYRMTDRSWFVMLTAVCVGIAMVFEPTIFITLAVIFAFTAWWCRESARQGIFTVALAALAAGVFLSLLSIVVYVIGSF